MWKSLVATVLLIAVWMTPASAAVTISGTCTDTASGVSPSTQVITVAGGLTGSVLVVAVMTATNAGVSAVSVNWDIAATNQSMTPLVNTTSGTAGVFMFGLRNPTATTAAYAATFTSTGGQVIMYACVFQGADVTSDATAFPVASRVSAINGAPIAVAVPSATGNIVFAGSGSVANFSSTTGVNNHFNNGGAQWATASDYWNTTGASTTVSASPGSGTTSSIAAFEVAQTGGAAAVTPMMPLLGVGP